MNAYVDRKIIQRLTMLLVWSALAAVAFADAAGPMQEYEDLKVLTATKEESLVVAGKVKAYIKSQKMMTSSEASEAIGGEVNSAAAAVGVMPDGDPQVLFFKVHLQPVIEELEKIVAASPATPLAESLNAALSKAVSAYYELAKISPDKKAAIVSIVDVVGQLEVAIGDGMLDVAQGLELMDQLTAVVRRITVDKIDEIVALGADAGKLVQGLKKGDKLWTAGACFDAVTAYADALANAEAPAEVDKKQELVFADGQASGEAILTYAKGADKTEIQVNCRDLDPDTEYAVRLCECDDDGVVTTDVELGAFTTNKHGKGHLHARVGGDVSDWCVFVGMVDDGVFSPLAVPSAVDDWDQWCPPAEWGPLFPDCPAIEAPRT
jgi:hypothetical protein